MKKIKAAILGIGTVGGGTYDILRDNYALIKRTQNLDIEVVKVLDKNPDYVLKRTGRDIAAKSIDEITSDKDISVVVETIGGVEPAKTFIIKSLKAGKSVVTANKELIAKHWAELEAAAVQGGAGLYFEASCMGGVPVIRTITDSMQANKIMEITGIINGTTNYIITKMSEDGMEYEEALKGAQASGFAELDPTADVEGYDAMYKLSILSSLAFHTSIPFAEIYREGITKLTKTDIKIGRELGYIVKLLAIGKRSGNVVEVRVHPTFVPENHPLAAVRNEFNGLLLKGNYVDDIMLYGRGAGAHPTGSAIVSDIVYCAKTSKHRYSDYDNNGKTDEQITINMDFKSKYYLSLEVKDSAGVLAKVTDILGKANVSIETITQKSLKKSAADNSLNGTASVIFLTHETNELSFSAAIKQIEALNEVKKVTSVIRVL